MQIFGTPGFQIRCRLLPEMRMIVNESCYIASRILASGSETATAHRPLPAGQDRARDAGRVETRAL